MTLREYLKSRAETQSAYAQRMGLARSVVSRIASGKRLPSAVVMKAIWLETDGKVSPTDFCSPPKDAA